MSIRVLQIKQLITMTGKRLAQLEEKKRRSEKVDNFAARIESNHCIFEDKTLRPGILSLARR